jgi:hypothetical protein
VNPRLFLVLLDSLDDQQNHRQYTDHYTNPHQSAWVVHHMVHHKAPFVKLFPSLLCCYRFILSNRAPGYFERALTETSVGSG